MKRHGIAPSDDERWEQIAQRAIEEAEQEAVELAEFYAGLVAIMDALELRLSACSELKSETSR